MSLIGRINKLERREEPWNQFGAIYGGAELVKFTRYKCPKPCFVYLFCHPFVNCRTPADTINGSISYSVDGFGRM